jgi:hypothetical protein
MLGKRKKSKIDSLDLTHPKKVEVKPVETKAEVKTAVCHCICGNVSKSFVRLPGKLGGGHRCMKCYQKMLREK